MEVQVVLGKEEAIKKLTFIGVWYQELIKPQLVVTGNTYSFDGKEREWL